MKKYAEVQKSEAMTWCIEDPVVRAEKFQREIIRYPFMAKQMGLDMLDTSNMIIWDIGGGPLGLSSILPCKRRVVIDPLADEYGKYFDTTFHVKGQGEELKEQLSLPDLVIVTNALDHFEKPLRFLEDLVKYGKSGMYFAHGHAINNAITHPHEAHEHNINPEVMETYLASDFELCWSYDWKHNGARYGWMQYRGRCGQPAFYQLWRKTTGYAR